MNTIKTLISAVAIMCCGVIVYAQNAKPGDIAPAGYASHGELTSMVALTLANTICHLWASKQCLALSIDGFDFSALEHKPMSW